MIATGIGINACNNGYKVLFVNAKELIDALKDELLKGTLPEFLKKLAKIELLIIDELSYINMDKEKESLFFQIIRQRYEKSSLIITTNLPIGRWNELFTGQLAATAILDRLLHHCHLISITGDSYRVKGSNLSVKTERLQKNGRKNKYIKEYNEYVKNTPMAEKEKEALWEWVMDGNSVHDNPSMSVDEHNRPTDFLDDYRYHEEIYQHLEQLTGKNRENYLARLRGEDTLDTLREDLQKICYERDAYYKVLSQHGLLQEAMKCLKAGLELSKTLQLTTSPFEELPFK